MLLVQITIPFRPIQLLSCLPRSAGMQLYRIIHIKFGLLRFLCVLQFVIRENWIYAIKRTHLWIFTIKRFSYRYIPSKDDNMLIYIILFIFLFGLTVIFSRLLSLSLASLSVYRIPSFLYSDCSPSLPNRQHQHAPSSIYPALHANPISKATILVYSAFIQAIANQCSN